jgi:hypothetical protein
VALTLVKEQRRSWVQARFLNKFGRLEAPLSVRYRIDCRTTFQQVRDWTDVTPASSVEIEISSNENRILGGNDREERVVTVIGDYGGGDLIPDEYAYVVKNLQGLA